MLTHIFPRMLAMLTNTPQRTIRSPRTESLISPQTFSALFRGSVPPWIPSFPAPRVGGWPVHHCVSWMLIKLLHTLRILLPLLIVVVVFHCPASAHEPTPTYMNITESTPNPLLATAQARGMLGLCVGVCGVFKFI